MCSPLRCVVRTTQQPSESFPRPKVFLSLLVALCVSAGLPLRAQGVGKSAKDTAVYTKPTITVMAARTSEDALEVPMAVTVVPWQLWQSTRGVGLDEALSLVPGALVQSRSGGTDVRVQIRGFGARGAGERSNAGTSRGIRFYTDGIPETEPDGRTSFDLIDLSNASSIEVVRSNASALWGNASGGVISISTVPTDNTPYIRAGYIAGSFGLMKETIQANTPLSSGQLYANISNTTMDGWRAHSNLGLTQATVGMISDIDTRSRLKVFVTGASNMYRIPGALTPAQTAADPQQAQDDRTVYNPTYVQRDEHRFNRLGRIGVVLDHAFSTEHGLSATAFLQSKYLQRSERNTFRDFTRYHLGGNLIYRYSTVFDTVTSNKVLVGMDVQRQDGAILFYNLDPATRSRGTELRSNKGEGGTNLGIFLQDEFMIGRLSVVGGLRYDDIIYDYRDFIDPVLNVEKTFSRLTPKIGLSYNLDQLAHVYANIGGGIEVPAGNELDPPAVTGEDTVTAINPRLDAIRSVTYEVGIKGGRRSNGSFITSLNYDAALYLIDITNDIVPYRNGRFYTTAGQSRRMGGELGLSMTSDVGLSLFASITVMKSEYRNYRVDSALIDPSAAGRFQSFDGNEMAGIPMTFGSLRLRYDIPWLTGLYAEAEARSIGSYYADDANTLEVECYGMVDAAIGADIEISSLLLVTAGVRVNNILDKKYTASAWINPDRTSGGMPYIEPGLPRNVAANVALKVRL